MTQAHSRTGTASPLAATRKDDHVRLAAAQHEHRGGARSPWDDVRLVHDALAGIDVDRVSLGTEVAGLRLDVPIYINAMTGGSARTGEINEALARAAAATGVAIATGSQSVALDHPETASSFAVVRELHPHGVVFANVGVERSPGDAARAVEMLGANALQVHVNAAQETVMPEGSREFSSWIGSLERIVAEVPVPVIVKEVGFGLSARTLELLASIGVAAADVSGRGGTDFVVIENDRRAEGDFDYLAGWGQSAPEALLDATRAGSTPQLIASGGVRTPLDVVRALALGARAVGVSAAFLRTVIDGGADALEARLRLWTLHTRALLALVGAPSPAALSGIDVVIGGETAAFAGTRGIDLSRFASRRAPHEAAARPQPATEPSVTEKGAS